MPIYEYVCKACKAKFEQLQRTMSSDVRVKCPECGSGNTSRELSVFAVAADSGKGSDGPPGGGSCGRCGGAPGSCSM